MNAVSIVVPTKNEAETIADCLRSIFDQSCPPLEVLLVDGGSTDNTLDLARNFDVKIIEEIGFSSPANARNLGAENAKGDVLLIMDADTILQKDCLRNALECFQNDNVIAVLPYDSSSDHSYLELIQRKWNEGSRTTLSVGVRRAKTSGGVIFLRKMVFEKVKYNTAYGFGEDDDFTSRLEKVFKGREILAVASCRVISHSPHTIREFGTRYMWWGRTFFAYLSRHFGGKSMLNMGSLVFPMVVVFTFLASLVFPQVIVVSVLFALLFVIKILIVCFRSRSPLFFQFVLFDFTRSFFFVTGLVQSIFVRKMGR